MRHRAVRAAVLLLALAAVGAAGVFVVQLERTIGLERASARDFFEQAHRATVLVEQLKAAQQAYVAEGQGPDFWMKRVDEVSSALERTLAGLAGIATTETTRTTAQAAANELAAFAKLDRRAREYVRAEQRLTASDLIFTESLGATGSLIAGIENARAEEAAAADATIGHLQWQQLSALGGAAAVAVLGLLLLLPRAGPERPKDTREALRALIQDGPAAPAAGLSIRPDPPVTARVTPPAVPDPPRAVPDPQAAPAAVAAGRRVDLAGTARLCGDMARVLDPADLPGLLQKAAALLNASGVIVWVADRAGASLFPTLAHGYPPTILARMGSIPRDADNAAAAAYRKAERQIVAATSKAPGALVTPIVTPEGCVGVLAAETRDGSEQDDGTRAVADILAAQLATFVTTLPGRTEEVRG